MDIQCVLMLKEVSDGCGLFFTSLIFLHLYIEMIYMFGGFDGTQDLGDFWRYDVRSASWHSLCTDASVMVSRLYVCVCMCICVHVYLCACVYVCMCVCKYVCMLFLL